MDEVRVGRLSAVILLIALVAMVSGCAWRSECPIVEKKKPEVAVDCAKKADVEALGARVTDLEDQVAANKEAAAEAMMTADKALKCCRKEFVVIQAEEVYFAFNSFVLDADSKAKIDMVADKLKSDPDYIIEIAGHTDAVGGNDYNVVLGQKRADAVRVYLVDSHHIAFSRISIRSGGKNEPIAENDTDAGRGKNRRATISVLGYSME